MQSEDEFFGIADSPRQLLKDTLIQAIVNYENNRPRSLQKTIGPSEVGADCVRKLAHKIAGTPALNSRGDPLPSMIGTAMHGVMEHVMAFENQRIGYERWITEKKVLVPISGTCDLYDNDTNSVLDWKFPGTTYFKKYVQYGPSVEYEKQVDTYGLGYKNLGYTVKNVGIIFVPRSGRLMDTHLWMKPFDEAAALATAERIKHINTLVEAFDLRNHPENARHFPATANAQGCDFCPWFTPGSTKGDGCCGITGDPNAEGLD